MSLKTTFDPDAFRRALVRVIAGGAPGSATLASYLAVCADERQPRHKAADAAGRRSDAIENLIRLSRVPRAVAPPHQTTREKRGSRTWKRDDLYDPMRGAGWTHRSIVYLFDEGFPAILPWARQRIVDGIGEAIS